MAHIRKRGSRYQVRGGPPGTTRTFLRQRDAEAYWLDLERRLRLGDLYQEQSVTFGEHARSWLARYKAQQLARQTVRRTQVTLQTLQPLYDLPVDRVTAAVVEDLLARLPAEQARKSLHLVKRLLRSAEERGQRIDRAVLRLRPPRVKPRQPRFLTPDEVEQLAGWLPDWCYRLVPFAALTGLRISELADLRSEDVDLAGRTLTVRGTKTAAAKRTIPLSDRACQIVREQLLARPPSDYVFPSATGRRLEPHTWEQRYFRPARDAAGLHGMVFHDLRATFASLLVAAGVHPRQAAELMGHSDGGALFLRRYGWLYETGRSAVEALDRVYGTAKEARWA
jgi:integrase